MFDKSDSITARPYPHLQTILSPERREELSTFFRREYCSLMGLSATSPLYLAATAGAIALPKLVKVSSIMKDKKTAWSSHNELPVRLPLVFNLESIPNRLLFRLRFRSLPRFPSTKSSFVLSAKNKRPRRTRL